MHSGSRGQVLGRVWGDPWGEGKGTVLLNWRVFKGHGSQGLRLYVGKPSLREE